MDVHTILLAALAGFISALVFSSIPVGPVNLTILNEGARRGFLWALLIGFGAASMEVIYCTISFTGFSSFFEVRVVKASMQVFTFVFLLFLGFKFILSQTINMPTKLDVATEKIEARLDKKLHQHSAFMIGFVRVMGNLGVLLTWIVLAAYFMAHDWVADTWPAKFACILGVLVGTNTWFLLLSFFVSRRHGKLSEKKLLQMQQFSGFCLLIAGLYGGGHIVWLLLHHKI